MHECLIEPRYRGWCRGRRGNNFGAVAVRPAEGGGEMTTTDPVCGMELEEATAAAEADYQDNRYYFCSETCREEFLVHPSEYVGPGERPGAY